MQSVGNCCSVRVMAVPVLAHCQRRKSKGSDLNIHSKFVRWYRLNDLCKHVLDFAGRTHANRVSETDFVATSLIQSICDIANLLWSDLTLEGTLRPIFSSQSSS